MNYILLILACALGGSVAFPQPAEPYNRFAPRQSSITWEPCYDNNNTQCGYYDVPLDYANPAAGKGTLAVIRYLATASPRLGTIFFNPGGPGGSGVQAIAGGFGPVLSSLSGGQYDIVSWDPRGVNNTKPSIECFTAEDLERLGKATGAFPEARHGFSYQEDIDHFYSQLDAIDAMYKEVDALCLAKHGDALKYVGSVATVRDMVSLSDYLNGAGAKINYWGFSYGTVIGSYFVNIYPDRVGRVVLDGVANPQHWSVLPPHLGWGDSIQSVDEALEGFVLSCAAAGPAGCALAAPTSTSTDVLHFVSSLIDKAYYYHKAGLSVGNFSSSFIRGKIHQGLYLPALWTQLAAELKEYDDIITAGLAGITKRALESLSPPRGVEHFPIKREAQTSGFSLNAITCADAIDPSTFTTKDVFDEILRVTREVSPMFGPQWNTAQPTCHLWTSRAVERYQGPWNHTLANPILIIGTEADPITPYASAKFLADQLGDSAVLVEQDDYGHLSTAMSSKCTIKIVHNYFTAGTLPTSDQFCGTDAVLFPGPGITKASLKAASVSDVDVDADHLRNGTASMKSFEQDKKPLLYVVISMGIAIVLLIVGLVAQFILYRRNRRLYSKVLSRHHDINKSEVEQQELAYSTEYSSPYDPHDKPSHRA